MKHRFNIFHIFLFNVYVYKLNCFSQLLNYNNFIIHNMQNKILLLNHIEMTYTSDNLVIMKQQIFEALSR